MKKLIDLDEEALKKLRMLAAKQNKPVKRYIESLILEGLKGKKL